MSRSLFALVLAGALTLPGAQLQAQEEVLGEWEMTTEGRGGTFTQTFAFTMEEGELHGTVTAGQFGTTELTDITFEDGTLTFAVTRTFRDNSFTQTYTGTIEGDQMTGTVEGGRGGRGGGPSEFTMQKVVD